MKIKPALARVTDVRPQDAGDDAAILAAIQTSDWPAMGLSEPQLIRAVEPMTVPRLFGRLSLLWKSGRVEHRVFLGLIFYRVASDACA